jgi:N-acetyl-anhydromuramyl-L-alanine amidase AmpD
MTTLIDFTKFTQKDFWAKVKKEGAEAAETVEELWEKVGEEPLDQDEAIEFLNCLFLVSHQRILDAKPALKKFYPTRQLTKNKLAKVEDLWWTDHFTAGISALSTLNWFSSKKFKKKNGQVKYAGASTHFVMPYHGLPYYIIPLMHGAWHEPRRNKDSISIEMVNAGKVKQNEDREWCYWPKDFTQPIPEKLVQELPPVRLDHKHRGIQIMQPFTREQIIGSIKLKRIVRTAMGERLELERMTQHQDWREGKTDMGPLWLFDDVNVAAFTGEPVIDLSFVRRYDDELDEVGEILEIDDIIDELDNPNHGELTPTHDDDEDDEDALMSIRQVQEALVRLNLSVAVDGKFGPKTKASVKRFQQKWNIEHEDDKIAEDGKPGPQTCARLRLAQKGL